jgi:hypothetical protein
VARQLVREGDATASVRRVLTSVARSLASAISPSLSGIAFKRSNSHGDRWPEQRRARIIGGCIAFLATLLGIPASVLPSGQRSSPRSPPGCPWVILRPSKKGVTTGVNLTAVQRML